MFHGNYPATPYPVEQVQIIECSLMFISKRSYCVCDKMDVINGMLISGKNYSFHLLPILGGQFIPAGGCQGQWLTH